MRPIDYLSDAFQTVWSFCLARNSSSATTLSPTDELTQSIRAHKWAECERLLNNLELRPLSIGLEEKKLLVRFLISRELKSEFQELYQAVQAKDISACSLHLQTLSVIASPETLPAIKEHFLLLLGYISDLISRAIVTAKIAPVDIQMQQLLRKPIYRASSSELNKLFIWIHFCKTLGSLYQSRFPQNADFEIGQVLCYLNSLGNYLDSYHQLPYSQIPPLKQFLSLQDRIVIFSSEGFDYTQPIKIKFRTI